MASNHFKEVLRLPASVREAAKAAALYGTLGVLWIILSDSVVNYLFDDPLAARQYQTYKGWFYVFVTAVLAYVVLRRALSRVERAQAVVEAEKHRLLQVVQHMPILMDARDEQGRILVWNSESERVTGYTAEEMVGNPKAMELLHPDAVQRASLFTDSRYRSAQFSGWEWELSCKDGSRRTIAWSSIAGRVPVPGWAHWRVGVDVTERRKAEDELRAAHQRLAFHVNNSPLAYIEWDSQRRIRRWSPRAEEIFGWRSEEALGKSDGDLNLVPAEEMQAVDETVEHLLRGSSMRNVLRNKNVRKDGTIVHCEWYNTALFGADGTVEALLSQVQDVTEQVESQRERQRLEAQVQHAQKLESLGVLAGGIAHDFNNLLVGILGNADLALLNLPEDHESRECLRDLVVAAQHAADLCKQMLAYSGKGRFVVEPVDMNEMLRGMSSLLQASISKRAQLQLELAESLPAVEADASQIRQVFMNLLINASDSLGEEDGRITVRSCVEDWDGAESQGHSLPGALSAGRYVCVEIQDTGCGMDEETRKKIFDPFFTTKFTGRGLGLAAVLGIIRGHQGTINVRSIPGEGSTFTLLFPALEEPGATIAVEADHRLASASVLVVDEEPLARSFATRLLGNEGFRVLCARDGQEALELLRANAEDVAAILLDVNLPSGNGRNLLDVLRSIKPEVPVVITSGESREASVGRLGLSKADAFLQKPFLGQALIEKLSYVIARDRAGH